MGLVLSAVGAVVLWAAGLFIAVGMTNEPNDNATDQQFLTYLQHHDNAIIAGSWLFMVGCVTFIVFGAFLRDRLMRYEGGGGIASSIAYAGTIGFAVAGLGIFAPKGAVAISANDVSASTTAAMYHLTDGFFMSAELMAILPTAAVAVIALRTGVLPRWWAIVSALLAVVLLIGPIGWAGLIFGMPVWTLGTGCMLGLRRSRSLPVHAAAPVTS
jgi:hypothetical protein